jgi:hypothetical protein
MNNLNEKQEIFVSYSDNGITDSHYERVPFEEKVVATIRNSTGFHVDLIKEIRTLTEHIKVETDSQKRIELEKEKKELKSQLQHFSMAKFKNDYRSNENFEYAEHLILDIDKLDDVESIREKFNNDNRTFFDFISASGNGLKVGYWLDQSITDEVEFKTVCKHYAGVISKEYGIEVDTTFDAARACFISYDPNFYINYECERLPVKINGEDTPTLSDLNSNQHLSSDENFIWNRWISVREGERNTTLVKYTGECIRMGIPADIACLTLIEWNKKNIPPLDNDEVMETVADVYQRYSDDVSRFLWSDDRDKLIFNHYEFKLFLEKQGYYKYHLNSGYIIVREENGIVDIIEESTLKEDILNLIGDVRKKEYIIARENSIFTPGKLDFLSPFIKKLNEDTKDKCHNYFTNGYVVVTKEGISDLLPYSTLSHPIWKSQIKQREFRRHQSIQSLIRSEIFQFIRNVSGKRKDRYWALITALGYLCHFYFDASIRKAVALYDETHPDSEGRAEGGKGKSLIGQTLRNFIINSAWVDGSELTVKDKSTYHNVNPDTSLIILDDLRRKFNLEHFFASITEGVTVDKKHKDPFIIKNVKMLMTSNFTLGGQGTSFQRRLFEIEIAPHYNLNFTPRDDFGHNLIDDWDEEQQVLSDNFMLWCEMNYLKKGLVGYKNVYINHKKNIENTCTEFFEYARKFKRGVDYSKNDEWNIYNYEYATVRIKKNMFTRWLRTFAEFAEWGYGERSTNQNKDKIFSFFKKLDGIKVITK